MNNINLKVRNIDLNDGKWCSFGKLAESKYLWGLESTPTLFNRSACSIVLS